MLVATHQTIVDGWSLGVFGDELATLYEAFPPEKQSPLAPLAIQYADYAVWQRQWRSHSDVAAQLAYWRAQLSKPLPVIGSAQTVRAGPSTPFRTAQREVALPERLTEAVKQFSHREGGTLFMALVAALKTLSIATWARKTCASPPMSPIAIGRVLRTYRAAGQYRDSSLQLRWRHPAPREVMRGFARRVRRLCKSGPSFRRACRDARV